MTTASSLSANNDAVARLRRAISASVFLSEEKKKSFLQHLDALHVEYVKQTEENSCAQNKEIARIIEGVGMKAPSPVVEFFALTPDFVSVVSSFVDELTTEVARAGNVEFLGEVSKAFREAFLLTQGENVLKMTIAQAFETLSQKGEFDPETVSSLEEALPGLRVLSADEDLDEDESGDLAELIAVGRVQIQEQVDVILARRF